MIRGSLLAAAFLLGLFPAPRPASSGCLEGNGLRLTAFLPLPGELNDLAAYGDRVYACGIQGLLVLDVSDPQAPQLLDILDIPEPRAIEVVGDWAFVTSYGTLLSLDLSNPDAPQVIDTLTFPTPSAAIDLAVSGTKLYVARLSHGVAEVDITDPTDLQLLGTIDTADDAWSVAAAGETAVAGLSNHRIMVLPAHPGLELTGDVFDVTVAGTAAYAALGDGFAVVDIADPDHPAMVEFRQEEFLFATGLKVYGNRLYVFGGDLRVYDLSQPLNPQGLGSLGSQAGCTDIAFAGDHGFLTCRGISGYFGGTALPTEQGGLEVVDLTEVGSPQAIFSGPGGRGLTVSGELTCIYEYRKLRLVNTADPFHPQTMSELSLPATPRDVALSGDRAYVAAGSEGLLIIDIDNPAEPSVLGAYVGDGQSVDRVTVRGDRAYLLGAFSGIRVVDVSDPAAPVDSPRFTFTGYDAVAVTEELIVALGSSLDLYDRREPHALRGSMEVFGSSLSVQGKRAYVATEEGLSVFDLADPDQPRILGTVKLAQPRSPNLVATQDHVYVLGVWGNIFAVDVADPEQPHLVGTLWSGTRTVGLAAAQNALLALSSFGFGVLPMWCEESSPASLNRLSVAQTPAGVLLEWETAEITWTGGFTVYRSVDNETWERATTASVPGGPAYRYLDTTVPPDRDVAYQVEALNLQGNAQRFGPVSLHVEPRVTLAARPNPTFGETTIDFSQTSPGPVSLKVYDLSGRLVARVLDGATRSAGAHTESWNGRSDTGIPAAGGVYFLKLSTRTGTRTRRVIKLP